MKKKLIAKGKGFEVAVHHFVQSLDPSAEVLFDHKVEDRDSKTMRQCDVWINTKIGGHWPISILVSCKDHKRKLHVGDIGSFADEIRSTGASTGVIYSRHGYTQPALQKAKANGIACCRLFANDKADIPDAIMFEQYTCNPFFRFVIHNNPDPSRFRAWNDIFNAEVENCGKIQQIVEILEEAYLEGQVKSIEEGNKKNRFPLDWTNELVMTGDEIGGQLRITMIAGWNRYMARVEGLLLNGSYSISNSTFQGSISGPAIDTWSPDPGQGWVRVEGKDVLPSNRILMILGFQGGKLKDHMRARIGSSPLEVQRDE